MINLQNGHGIVAKPNTSAAPEIVPPNGDKLEIVISPPKQEAPLKTLANGFIEQIGVEVRHYAESLTKQITPQIPGLEDEIFCMSEQKEVYILGYQSEGEYNNQLMFKKSQLDKYKAQFNTHLIEKQLLSREKFLEHLNKTMVEPGYCTIAQINEALDILAI